MLISWQVEWLSELKQQLKTSRQEVGQTGETLVSFSVRNMRIGSRLETLTMTFCTFCVNSNCQWLLILDGIVGFGMVARHRDHSQNRQTAAFQRSSKRNTSGSWRCSNRSSMLGETCLTRTFFGIHVIPVSNQQGKPPHLPFALILEHAGNMPTLRILQLFALALQAVSTRSPVMRC